MPNLKWVKISQNNFVRFESDYFQILRIEDKIHFFKNVEFKLFLKIAYMNY